MEDPLIQMIIQAASKNDTKPLEEFISSKESLKIDCKTLNCLQSIVCQDSKGLNEIKCVLSCLKYFCEHRLDKKIWDKLAKKSVKLCVMCLNQWVVFYKKGVREESILVYMMEIVSELIEQSEFIVRAFHNLMVQPLIRLITKGDFPFKVKCTFVKTVNDILRSSVKDNHCEINPLFQEDIKNFSNWIFLCGDFETQTIILEALVYFRNGTDDPNKFCAEWFDSYWQIKTDFLCQEFNDFEPESRVFLNSINKLNKNQLVYSLGCVCAFMNGVKLEKPNDLNYPVFWVDFNVCSENVLIHYRDDDNLWERLTLYKENILEVCSNIGEFNLNTQITQIVKLCFDLNNIVSSVKYVEIWFEISEEFCCLENSFLIPIYGYRYQCNWKASSSNYLMSNEALSLETIRSQNTSLSLRKYPPLPVIITPRKFSQNSKSLTSDQNFTPDSSISRHSNQRNELLSTHLTMYSGLLDSDDNSLDEIMPTPQSVQENASKRKLTNNKVEENVYLNKNEVLSSITNQTKLSPDNHQEEEIIETYLPQSEHELKSPKILNNQDETNKMSKSSSKKNPLKSNSDCVKRRKLFSVSNEEVSLNSPLYETSQDDPNPVTEEIQTVIPKVSYSYRRTLKKQEVTSDNVEPTTSKTVTMKITDKKKFFKRNDSDEALNTALTPNLQGLKKHTVYSDLSVSSTENVKSVKKTYIKNKKVKKRQKRVKFSLHIGSDSDPDFDPGKSSQAAHSGSKKKRQSKRSFVSTLEKKVDPLRFRDNVQKADDDEHLFTPEILYHKTSNQKDIGEAVFSQFDNTQKNLACENSFLDPKEISKSNLSVPVLPKRSLKLKNKKKVQLNSAIENIPKPEEQQLNKEQLPLVNKEQNEEVFKSVYEVQDIEMCSMLDAAMTTNDTANQTQNSSLKTSGVSKIEKKTCSREKDLSNFGLSLLKSFLKNIEETKTTLQTERQAVYTTFISYLDEQKRNNLKISGQLEKCRKALEKTDNEIEMVRQNFTESILKLELKQNKKIVNHLKELKSEMKEMVKIYIEE